MKTIITLTGLKQSGKWKLANKWDKNENVSFINPYTDAKHRPQDMIYLSADKLAEKSNNETVLCSTMINGRTYAYFESQLKNDFNIFIVDDYALNELVDTYDGRIVKIWVENPKAEASERNGHFHSKDYYDYVFNVGLDDADEFLETVAFDVEMVQG